MELNVIRHGETTANKEKIAASIMVGHYDNLTKRGETQATELMSELKKHDFDIIILSPMKRTLQTIQPYLNNLKIKPKIITLDLVTERNLGDLSGETMLNLKKIKEKSRENAVRWIPLNGESEIDVEKRAKKFVEYIIKNFDKNSKILLCSHSNFLKVLDIVLTKGNIMDFPNHHTPDNCVLKKYTL